MLTRTGTLHYKAPEMFESYYNETVDIWAIGVTAFEFLQGRMPFNSEYEADTIKVIRKGEYSYDDEPVKIAVDFIKRVLRRENRLNAQEALNHPWLFYDCC